MNQKTQEQGSESDNLARFQVRGRHPNLYPVDLPDVLDDGIKDELLTTFSITLLKNLVSLLDEDARAGAESKHVHSDSNVSQPESVTFSLNSSMGGSVDVDTVQAAYAGVVGNRNRKAQKYRDPKYVESWRSSSSGSG